MFVNDRDIHLSSIVDEVEPPSIHPLSLALGENLSVSLDGP